MDGSHLDDPKRKTWFLVGTLNAGGWIILRMDEATLPLATVVDVGPFKSIEHARGIAETLANGGGSA